MKAVDWQVVDGYVWCEPRGMIHDDTRPWSVARHGLDEFWDIYQDGILCNPQTDHHPVGARLPEDVAL